MHLYLRATNDPQQKIINSTVESSTLRSTVTLPKI
uniref:Uncharacterized protein n=1 Tax=Arundo donax TaxID=35708 RepID=A0A0A9GPN3_ARUDO